MVDLFQHVHIGLEFCFDSSLLVFVVDESGDKHVGPIVLKDLTQNLGFVFLPLLEDVLHLHQI